MRKAIDAGALRGRLRCSPAQSVSPVPASGQAAGRRPPRRTRRPAVACAARPPATDRSGQSSAAAAGNIRVVPCVQTRRGGIRRCSARARRDGDAGRARSNVGSAQASGPRPGPYVGNCMRSPVPSPSVASTLRSTPDGRASKPDAETGAVGARPHAAPVIAHDHDEAIRLRARDDADVADVAIRVQDRVRRSLRHGERHPGAVLQPRGRPRTRGQRAGPDLQRFDVVGTPTPRTGRDVSIGWLESERAVP